MKLKVLLLALVCLFVAACLASPSDLDAKKKKKRTPTPIPSPTVQVTPMPTYLLAVNLTTATVPNFTPAAGDFILPNSDIFSSNFVLQGDTTGGGTWATIPVTEWQLFPKRGKVAQRPIDAADGSDVDWGIYFAFRIHEYTKSVGGVRTTYTDETVTFADEAGLYSPIGVVGELNGEAIQDVITNFVVAGGGDVVIDDTGITILPQNGSQSYVKWVDPNGEIRQYINAYELGTGTTNGTFSTFIVSAADSETVGSTTHLFGIRNGDANGISFQYNVRGSSHAQYPNGAWAALYPNNSTADFKGLLVAGEVSSSAVPNSLFEIKRHTDYAGSGWNHETAAVHTTDNSITTLFSKTLADETVYQFTVYITARRSDTPPENGIYARRFGVYREGGGATLIAAADTIGTDRATTLAGTITVDTSGNAVRVRVTGETGKTVEWVSTIEWQAVSYQ